MKKELTLIEVAEYLGTTRYALNNLMNGATQSKRALAAKKLKPSRIGERGKKLYAFSDVELVRQEMLLAEQDQATEHQKKIEAEEVKKSYIKKALEDWNKKTGLRGAPASGNKEQQLLYFDLLHEYKINSGANHG